MLIKNLNNTIKRTLKWPLNIIIWISLSTALFTLFTASALITGCATSPLYRTEIISVDEFPDFIVEGDQVISPVSVNDSLPDVDILMLNDHIKEVLDESVTGIRSQRERLESLISLINSYVKIDASYDRYGAQTAIETFESGTGNCLSFSNLFVAMARYAGFRTRFQEIQTPPNWIKNGEVLFFTRHIGATIDIDHPAYHTINIDDIRGNKAIVWVNNSLRYNIIPLLPNSLMSSTMSGLTSRPIPDNRAFAQYYNNIGSQYLADGDSVNAFRYFVKAIKIDPELSYLWSNLAVLYRRNYQADAAEKALLQALSINRDKDRLSSMTIMSNLANLYTIQGKNELAAEYEERVRVFRDKNPYYHYSIGEAAFFDGRYLESVEHFKDAIRRKDDEHNFYYALSMAYYNSGDMREAEKNMNKAKEHATDKEIVNFYSQLRDRISENISENN